MVIPCPICGKLTAIYWPQFWVYRRGETYYCSENCLVVDRTRDIRLMNQVARERLIRKGVEDMGKHRLTLEQKKKAVEIANQGGDYLAYLKKCGAKNPSAAWAYIKKTLVNKIKEDVMAIPPIKVQAPAEETAEKPILAEVVEKVPEVIVVPHDDIEKAASYPTVKARTKERTQGTHRIKTSLTMDERGLRIEQIPETEMEVVAIKSQAVPGQCFMKTTEQRKNEVEQIMSLESLRSVFNLGVILRMNRAGWLTFIEEIKQAMDQMKI